MKFLKSTFYCLSVLVILFSCFKKEEFHKIELQEINPAWGVPLIDSRLTLKDVVAELDTNLGIRENPDLTYTFYYYDTLSSPKAEDVFKLPDQAFTKAVLSSFPIAVVFPAGQQLSSSFSQAETFDAGNGSSLKSVDLKGGQLEMDVSSLFKNDVTIQLTIFSLLDPSGKPFTRQYSITSQKSFISDFIDLQGYQLSLTDSAGNTNSFRYTASYTVTSTGQPLQSNDGLFVSIKLSSLKYRRILGDIGPINFPELQGNLNLKVFEQASYGNIYFSQAKLTMNFDNSLGIPVDFTINKLRSTTSYGKTVDITPVNPPMVIHLAAPDITEQGSFKRTEVILSNSNSQIVDAVNPAPNNLEYDLATNIQPGVNNFILDESRVKVYARIEIPLVGYITDFELKDTLLISKLPDRTFSGSGISGAVDSILFKLKIENSVPADAFTQLYFLDSSYKMVDSLLLKWDYILASDNVNPVTGIVTAPTVKETSIPYNGTRYDVLKTKAKYFYISSRVITPVDKTTGKPISIKLQADNFLRVVVSVLTKGEIKIE